MSIEAFAKRIVDVGADLATLDVVTLSGKITVTTKDNKIDFKALVKSLQDGATKATGDVHVVAFTHIDLDKDAVNFVKSDLSDEEAPLIAAHNDMVKTAQEARLAVVNFIKKAALG